MKIRATLLSVLAFGAVVAVLCLMQYTGQSSGDASASTNPIPADLAAARESGPEPQPTPVALNRGPEVLDGFRGDVHPLLSGSTRMEVSAEWTPVSEGRDELHRKLHPRLYAWFKNLQPTRPRQTYTEREFSAFLPETLGEVGQVWALDDDKIVSMLKQFHPRPSLHLVAAGRRAGPDGAFAMLRAVSPSYADIVFRIHAEFYLTPDDWPADQPRFHAWYTPAYLSGRILVNRQTGTVDYFRMGLPTDKALNVHLTLVSRGIGDVRQARDIVRVERMELSGGDAALVEKISWPKALPLAETQSRLAKVFFKFLEIDWLPFDQALVKARSLDRPIFAVVSWGAFEDQSC
jgi:hypothetical protein